MPALRSLGFLSLLIATPAAAQVDLSSDVTVTGIRIKDYEQALADCIARHCPPNEEIAATLALANQQVRAGDYQAARTALLKSRGRNARFAKQFPVAVANLHHANSIVAGALGQDRSEMSSAIDAISAMKAGIPADDPRVFMERLELADAYTRGGRTQEGEKEYARVADRAHSLGLPMIEAEALLRKATLEMRRATREPAIYSRSAQQAIERVTAFTDPAAASAVRAARVLEVQLAGINGRTVDLDKLVAEYPPLPAGTPPVLLYTPLMQPQHQNSRLTDSGYDPSTGAAHDNSASRIALENFEGQWVDLAFTVGQDGRVSDVQIARQGKQVEGDWAQRIMSTIAGRRYAPQVQVAHVQERYSYTSNWVPRTGSRILARSPQARLDHTYFN